MRGQPLQSRSRAAKREAATKSRPFPLSGVEGQSSESDALRPPDVHRAVQQLPGHNYYYYYFFKKKHMHLYCMYCLIVLSYRTNSPCVVVLN